MLIKGKNIGKKNLIFAAIFFSITLFSIFSVLTSAHEGEEGTTTIVNAELSLSPSDPQPNQNIVLDFYLSDDSGPITTSQLQETHTKLFHLIGMRNDLTNFFHIHPIPSDLSGHYVVNHEFLDDGVYTLWLEFMHDNREFTRSFTVVVGNGQTFPLTTDFSTSKIVENYLVEISVSPSNPIAGKDTKLSFDISDASTGESVTLGTHLGAFAHVIAVDTELHNFVHSHHEEDEELMFAGHFARITGRHVEEGGSEEASPESGHVNAVVNFQESGTYKIFLEFNPTSIPDSKVVMAEFMLSVGKASVFNLFYLIFAVLLIITIIVTIIIANYSKTGEISLFATKQKKVGQVETQEKVKVPESEKRFRKILVTIGFILFSIFVIGMIWLGTGYDPQAAEKDVMFWYILSYTAGLSMIFLPCTLPLAFVIVPLSMGQKPKKGFFMALLFGLGLIITITSYGVGMAAVGKILGFDRATQIMWLGAGSVAFFFGLGELQLLPLRVPGYSGALPGFFQRQGDYIKSFLMGLFLGNAGAGCPNPAFYVLLTYITTVGSIGTGALLGLIHGVGRALPLIFLSIAGILGINATQAIVKHKDRVERGIGFVLVVVGGFILMLGIYGKAWWENSIVHKVWSEFLSLINPEFGEAAAGAGNAPLTPFYVLTIVTALIVAWYYLDKKYFGPTKTITEETSAKPEGKPIEEKIYEELMKLEELQTKIEQLGEKQIKELEEIKTTLKKTEGEKK